MTEPKYKHDCDECVFLGRFDSHDLYWHARYPTIVARFGSDEPDYLSSLAFIGISKPITKGFEIAVERGLVPDEVIAQVMKEKGAS